MHKNRKAARDYLNSASLTSFWDIVREAKISKEDQKILDAKFVDGLSVVEISMKLGYSPEKVKNTIKKAYDKVAATLLN